MKASRIVIVGLVLLAGCGRQAQTQGEDLRPVETIVASRAAALVTSSYAGEIRARHESRLGFKVSGKLAERLVEVGARVSAGQPLLRLDAQDAALSAAAATAESEAASIRLAQADIDLRRGRDLFGQRFISEAALDQYQVSLDTARSQLRAARAQQQLAHNQHQHTLLRAERAGVVTAIEAEIGEVVSVGQPVLTVAADDEREVSISIPESRLDELRDARMSVSTWAEPSRVYPATLRELAPDADRATRTYAARISIAASDASLRLGMTATVRLEQEEASGAIRVPLAAVDQRQGSAAVWVLDPHASTVARRQVTLGGTRKYQVQIASGLREGELVVSAGVHLLHPGQKVKQLPNQLVARGV